MDLKLILCSVVLSITVFSASAQDKIFQGNGNVIKAVVTNVNEDNIVYKLWAHQDGKEYTIRKSEVDKIKYESGRVEYFTTNEAENNASKIHEMRDGDGAMGRRRMRNNTKFGNSILAIAPIQLTEQGVGFAVNYEHAIDKEGYVSYNLPLVASFDIRSNSGYDYNSGYYNNYNNHQDAMFYFCPGIKFYPTGMFGKCKYSIGPSIVAGVGQETTDIYVSAPQPAYSSYSPNTYGTYDKLIVGVMLTNSLNISPTKHLYMGVDYSFGFTYLRQYNGINSGNEAITQFAFKMGYRF
jgi:hypothetical protein